MTLLAPGAAVLALALPAIVALYFLKIRRPTRIVPALHLWPNQIRDRQANVPWQRLRPSWLLFLQLLAAAVLVAAALQPALPAGAALARHSLVLVHASASMQATDLTPSRLAEARRQVNAVIDQLGPSDRMTIIAVGPTARIVASVTGDRDALHRAVNGLRTSNGPAGPAQDVLLPVPSDATSVTARLDGSDVFALDHSATAVAKTPRAFRVLLVTPGNVFLEKALRLRADLQIDVVAPAAYRPSAAYAMTVFDRFAPPTMPDGPVLVVDPPAGSALAGGKPVGIGRVRAADAGDQLLANVDLQDVHVARSQDLRSSTFGRPLITSQQTPLVLVREEPFRQVLFGFDLHESDLPLRIAFPILTQNLSEWMLPPSVPSHSFHPDEPVTIVPEPGATTVSVIRPDGSRGALATGAIASFAGTDPTGLYVVEQVIGGQVQRSWFSVNLFSDAISQLKPPDRLTLPPTRAVAVQATHPGQLEIWPWIALAALAIVTAEWLAFHRGL